jgi:hypothetical protein
MIPISSNVNFRENEGYVNNNKLSIFRIKFPNQ